MLFQNNFNCSQAVLAAFASDFGLSEELALKLGTQFGGGARNGEMCGVQSRCWSAYWLMTHNT